MKKLLIILSVLVPILSNGQIKGDNSILLSMNGPLLFSYSSIDELLAPKILHNAIELKLTGKSYSRNIMAQVTYTGLRQSDIPADWMVLKLVSKNSYNAIIYNSKVNISTSPVLLFTQPASTPTNNELSFVYDLVLNPLNTFVNTGSYNFTITISILQP